MDFSPSDDPQQIEAHLKDVYERHAHHIAHHLQFLLGDEEDAREVTQEAFIRYVAFLKRGGKPLSPMHLLMKIATRLGRRLIRRRVWKTKQTPLLSVPEPEGEASAGYLYSLEVLRTIWDALDSRGKTVAKAWLADEMTESEIANYTDIPRSSVQRRIKQIQSIAREKGIKRPRGRAKTGQNRPLDASNKIEGQGEEDLGNS